MRKFEVYDPDGSGYGNEVLYRMCAEEPSHADIDVVRGKIWLIGRSYSASIERRAGSGFKLGRALEKVYGKNMRCFKVLDQYIENITGIQVTTNENLDNILLAHKFLVEFFCELIKSEKRGKDFLLVNKRSLASKYLHFHAPKSVFIFDSVVGKNIKKKLFELKLGRKYFSPTCRPEFDSVYEVFARRCIYYRDRVLKKEDLSPRKLDMNLYGDEYY
jgi:hypothetical protein